MVCLSFHDFERVFICLVNDFGTTLCTSILYSHYSNSEFLLSVYRYYTVVSFWLLILVPTVTIQSKLYMNSNSAVTIRSHELKFLWPKILSLLMPCTSVNSDVVHFNNSDIDLVWCSNDPLLHSISGHFLLQTKQVDMLIN